MSSKKALNVYFRGAKQKVKYYKGTKKAAILELLFQSFALEKEGSFATLAKNVLFMDEDGDPVAFDPEAIPSGVALTMSFTHILLPSDSKREGFSWDSEYNQKHSAYKLSASGRVAESTAEMKEMGYGKVLLSNRTFRSGVHKWSITLDTAIACYSGVGVLAVDLASKWHTGAVDKCGSEVRAFFLMPAYEIEEGKRFDVVLDMDKRVMTVNGKTFKNVPKEVKAALAWKGNNRAVLRFN